MLLSNQKGFYFVCVIPALSERFYIVCCVTRVCTGANVQQDILSNQKAFYIVHYVIVQSVVLLQCYLRQGGYVLASVCLSTV